ncbi:MAG: transcription termination factor NusA [Rickettsiaceae bacterium]|nr:transcription termination factor NusA [Rickettsiaceae bacterium]
MVTSTNTELLHVIDSVSREKGISKDLVLDALAKAIKTNEAKRYGGGDNIKVEISRKNGEIRLYRSMEVVEEVVNDYTQIDLSRALENNSEAQIGESILEELPDFSLSRVSAQSAKRVIEECIKDVEKQKEYNDFSEREGEMFNGKILRLERSGAIIDLAGRSEALLPKKEQIASEHLVPNNYIKICLKEVKRDNRTHQLIVSRTDNRLLRELLAIEVPEIEDKLIEIKALARDAGSKAKVAVFSTDNAVDVIGSCIGLKGSRIQAVTRELGGEKIDLVLWSPDVAQFAVNSLTPATISKVVIDNDQHKLEVIVGADQLSAVLGRRGQNVKLAAKLTGWNIDILTDEQESRKKLTEFTDNTSKFMEALDVDEVLAQLIVAEGFSSVEQLANSDLALLMNIEGFDEELSSELKNRAEEFLAEKNAEFDKIFDDLGVDKRLIEFLSILSKEEIVKLSENGIKTFEDLLELKPHEFKNMITKRLSNEQIQLIFDAASKLAEND